MDHAETETFGKLRVPMDAVIIELDAQRNQLARTIKNTKKSNSKLPKHKQKKTSAKERSLVLIDKRIDELLEKRKRFFNMDSSLFNQLDIVNVYVEQQHNFWTEESWRLNALPDRKDGEGEFEKSYRDIMCLSLDNIPGTCFKIDFWEIDQEGKKLQCHAERGVLKAGNIQSIRLGAESKKLVDEVKAKFFASIEQNEGKLTGEELMLAARSEIGKTTLAILPARLRDALVAVVKPSVSMVTYKNGLVCFVAKGFFVVPYADFDEAFSLKGISQGVIHYNLEIDYIVRKILELSAVKHQLNVAA